MSQPEGCEVPGQENKVCKLRKFLCGLKQAPKQWYEKFASSLQKNGFTINNSDSCVHSKIFGSGYVIICLYVDDILIFDTNLCAINETKRILPSLFEMKDLGEAYVILGIKLVKTKSGFSSSQSHYIEKVLKKF